MSLKPLFQTQLNFVSLIKGCVAIFENEGGLDAIYDLEDELSHIQAMQVAVEHARAIPGVAEMMQERYIAPPPDLETLLQYPPNSLGHCYAASFQQTGFDPNFYRHITVQDDTHYLLLRLRQTHDIWHLVTGFGTDVFGELELKAFEFAQTRRPIAVILLAGALLKLLIASPELLGPFLKKISQAYLLGTETQPLLAQKWEQHWEKPVSQWQQELGLRSE